MNTDMVQGNSGTGAAALPHVQEVLRTASEELAELFRQRSEIMRRMGTIKQMLTGMANLFGESILDRELRAAIDGKMSNRNRGFTLACRQILLQARTPLSARECSEEMRRKFPQIAERHKDLSASVTTVLHRLAAYGEARCYLDRMGTRVWEWVAERDAPSPERGTTEPVVPPIHDVRPLRQVAP